MQRNAIRASVGGTPVDIPLGTFTAGQPLVYDGTQVTTVGGANVALAVTTNQFSFTSSLSDIAGLTYAIPFVGNYVFQGMFLLSTSSSSSVGFAVNYSGTATLSYVMNYSGTPTAQNYTSSATLNGPITSTVSGTTVATFIGTLFTTTTGTFAMRASTSVAGLTLFHGSCVTLTKV